jgi:hypothetical protein
MSKSRQWPKHEHEARCGSDTCAEAEGDGRTACHPKSAGSGTRDKRPNADGNVIDPKGGAAQSIGRPVGDGSSQQPLCYAQLQAPECGTQRRQPDSARIGQHHISANQDDRADPELETAIDVVRENTERISGPTTNPATASAKRKPKPSPRISLAVRSARNASRGASRIPLVPIPKRSTSP